VYILRKVKDVQNDIAKMLFLWYLFVYANICLFLRRHGGEFVGFEEV